MLDMEIIVCPASPPSEETRKYLITDQDLTPIPSTTARENGIAFGKNQQLAWLNPVPILIAQRLAGHDVSPFIWIYDLCQIDRQVLATKSDNFVWRLAK